MNGPRFLETLWQDALYASRMMRRKPIFTATVAATLALGIGANAAVFAIVQAVLLQPLPYKNPSRLVAIWDKNVRDSGISKMFDSFQDFREVTQHASSFEEVAARHMGSKRAPPKRTRVHQRGPRDASKRVVFCSPWHRAGPRTDICSERLAARLFSGAQRSPLAQTTCRESEHYRQ